MGTVVLGAAGIGSGLWKLLLVGHILAAIIGFGAVFLGPLYGLQAKKRQGAEGLVVAEAAHFVGGVAEKFIMAVPVFGVLMVLISNDVYKFSQTWVWLALALYAVALTTALRVHIPNLTRMNELMAQLVAMGPPPAVAVGPGAATAGPPPEVLELEARGKRAGMLSLFLNCMLITILALMVWRPA